MHSQTGLYPGDVALDTKVVSIWMNWCKPRKVPKLKKNPEKKKKPQKKKKPIAIKVSSLITIIMIAGPEWTRRRLQPSLHRR